MAMDEQKKAALLAKLKAGREKYKAAREDAKAKGLPDPKPRKKRASKNGVDPAEALANPAAAPAANETIAPIDGAPRNAVNTVAAKPVDPTPPKSTPIDVPNLPGEDNKVASKADIVKDAEAIPDAKTRKNGLSSTGIPAKINDNELLVNEETGNQAIEVNFPGQKESIKKLLKANKKDNPETPAPQPMPKNKTVKQVKEHIPNMDTLEARQPFSFSTVRKLLYQ